MGPFWTSNVSNLTALLRDRAYTEEDDAVPDRPSRAAAVYETWEIEANDNRLLVRATTKRVFAERELAFEEALSLFDAIVKTGDFRAAPHAEIGIFSTERETEDEEAFIDGWFGSVRVNLYPRRNIGDQPNKPSLAN